jgi:uncharacterized protein YecT (DUF1311 family)
MFFVFALLVAASPAVAFDCRLAKTKAEKAICADPAARAADAEMAKAYGALSDSLDGKQRAALVKAQGRWLTMRDNSCSDEDRQKFAACLADQSAQRRAFLAGAAQAGPGAPAGLAPFFRIEAGGKGRADVDIEVLRFVHPADAAERAFNAAVDQLSSNIEQPDGVDSQADNYAFSWTMRLAYASPRLISAHAEGYASNGGAHPNTSSVDVNIDMRAGREATFASLLDGPAARRIFALCTDEVTAEKKRREGADADVDGDALKQLRQSVAATTDDLKSWSFGADAATVSYDPYAVGAYAEGAFTCEIPYATLRPLAKPDFPLP